MNLVRALHPHRRAIFVMLGLLLLLGGRAVFTSARSIYPRVAFPRIAVIAERGEFPVRGMLIDVTRPIEQAVSTVPDLVRVRSKTVRGASEFSLDFKPDAAMRDALSLVRARVASSGLSADVKLTIEQQTPAVFPVISFNVVPPDGTPAVGRARIGEWVEADLKPRLARLPDAFMVTVQSGDSREYAFEADPIALARHGVTLGGVREALAQANVQAAVGRSTAEGLQYQLLVDGRIDTPDGLLEVAVAREKGEPVRLRQLGSVVETVADHTMIVTGDGRDGIVVSVFLRDGGKVTDLSAGVKGIIAETRALAPLGAAVTPVYDQAELVEASITGVRDAIAIGAALSVIVLLLFLGNWRITLVAGLAIPISVVLTLALFPLLGESLNLMSLGGLAVAIGLIIDDAIVVVENVARRLAAAAPGSAPPLHLVAEATQEVLGAIVGSSLTTVVVFLPLVLLEGVVGQFFRSLSFALGASIVASLVVSLVCSPLMLLMPGLTPRSGLRPRRWMVGIQDAYARSLGVVLNHPLISTVVLVAALGLGAAGLRGGLATGFLPEMDEGGFVLDYTLPVGSSLVETDAACRRIEAVLRETPEVASFSRRTGAELGFFATEQFTGDMLVGLKPRSARQRSVFAVIDGLRDQLAHEVPQADVEFVQVIQDTINDLAGEKAALEVKLLGTDYQKLQHAADDVAAAMEKIPGVVDVKNGVSFGSPELTWRVDPWRAARLGLNTTAIAEKVEAQLLGSVATRIQEADRFIDVRVRYSAPWRAAGVIEGGGPPLFVDNPHGDGHEPAPLTSLATFSRALNENELERENQTPMVRVTASVSGGDLGAAAIAVARAVQAIPRDPAVRVEMGGQSESQRAAFENLVLVFGLGAGLVFLLLVIQFRSLRLPVVMFLALPFGQIGALYALHATKVALNISSGMGLIMLVGLVVKNGIILIEYAQDLRRSGRDERDAIIEAARTRLRPVLMTTIAAIAGLFPLALGVGAGSELQRPLAIAVIGGLAVSTVFTLIVVPLGCAVLARGRLVGD